MKNSSQGLIKTDILTAAQPGRLECLCTPSTSCFQTGASIRGVERLEARFIGSMFSPHRHDTYALGLTLSGIQTFTYRGEQRFSAAGNIIVLHPDELHDGGAGTDAGLTYRMIYLPPELILDASEGYGQPLPFVSTPVIRDHDLATTLYDALKDLSTAPDDIEMDDIQMRLAAGLHRNSGNRNPTASIAIDTLAVRRVAEFLSEHALEAVSSQRLEAISGLDRFALSRHFRRRMGTSPHRFQMMRRLQRARVLLMHHNTSLADAAIATGFADQAHFSRHFKATYGLPPGQWLSLLQSRTASSHIR